MDSGLPRREVTIDRITEHGVAVHESSEKGQLRLGTLPESAVGESLLVEIWGPNEGRVVDQRYCVEPNPPESSLNRSATKRMLSVNNHLSPGDHVVGVVQKSSTDNTPLLVTSGYRVQVPGVRDGELVVARIEEAHKQKFGANSAKATRVGRGSLFDVTAESGIGIKRLMADGRWREPVISELERRTLREVVQRVGKGNSVSVLYPGFEPESSLRVAIELLYHSGPGTNVAFLTSGSSVQWGLKGEIRAAYRGYGLSSNPGSSNTAAPLDQIFSHSYVYDGEMKTSSRSLLDRRLVLTKKLDDLSVIPNLSAIVVDYTSRRSAGDEESIEFVQEKFPEVPIVSITSPFTKNEGTGVPKYAPPTFFEETDTVPTISDIQSVAASYEPQVGRETAGVRDTEYVNAQTGSPGSPMLSDLLGLLREPSTTVSSVESGLLEKWFQIATDRSHALLNDDIERAGFKVYSIEMFYERLPVPVDRYNEWIRDEWESGERYLPDTTDAVLEELETYGKKIDDLQAPAPIFAAHKALCEIDAGLREENPLFEQVCTEVSNAIDRKYRIGIFCPRKSWSHVLGQALLERGFASEIIGTNVVLVDPDSIRDMPPCYRLVFTGPQRPQYAGFYHHPRALETVIYTYDGRWGETISKHARGYLESLNRSTSGSTEQPYSLPEGTGEDEETSGLDVTEREDDDDSEKERKTVVGGNGDNDLEDEDLTRLRQLVEAAPTKNRELAKLWGYDSGSEVYRYLSTHLSSYYERGEDKLIVPTEAGRQLVDEVSKP